MNIKQSLILALKSMMASKMRSFLTMLGIIIGITSVIVLVSMIDGFSANLLSSFESMGTNQITVNIIGRGGNRNVTPEDMISLAEKNLDTISSVSPTVNANSITVKLGSENVTTTCMGVNEMYGDIANVKISSGRFLSFVDVEQRQKNLVIGSYIAQELFSGTDPLGKTMKVGNDTYTVVGVAEEKASSVQGSLDDRIYMSYSLAAIISGRRTVTSYVFSAASKDTAATALEKINEYLMSVFNDANAFRANSQTAALAQIDESMNTVSMIMAGIAGISLLVGGIGIMNIMLVSVTERTREIGIRKSLGATPWDIMSQFVVEAAVTGSFGGLIGILLGVGGSLLAGHFMQMNVIPSAMSILLAFSVSFAIGMIFGYFPAKKASRLNPIDALRYE